MDYSENKGAEEVVQYGITINLLVASWKHVKNVEQSSLGDHVIMGLPNTSNPSGAECHLRIFIAYFLKYSIHFTITMVESR